MSNTQNPGSLPSVTGAQVVLVCVLAAILAALISFLVWQVGGDALPWLSSVFGLTATGAAAAGFVQNRHIQATTSGNMAAIASVDAQLNGPMSAKIQTAVEAAMVNVTGVAPSVSTGDHVAPPVPDAGPVSP